MTISFDHEVEIEGDEGETEWVPCVVLGRRVRSDGSEPGYDVRTEDGKVWTMCHADCVRKVAS